MYEDDVTTCWFSFWWYLCNLVFLDKTNLNSKYFALVGFCTLEMSKKVLTNYEILQLAWTLTPNEFPTKCLRCLIFTQTIAFHSYFMEITTLISTGLQLNRNGSSKLLNIFIKSILLAISSYHYGFFKKSEIFIF